MQTAALLNIFKYLRYIFPKYWEIVKKYSLNILVGKNNKIHKTILFFCFFLVVAFVVLEMLVRVILFGFLNPKTNFQKTLPKQMVRDSVI